MNYKHYISTGFAGCRLLAYAYDHCRNREVRLFLLPSTRECVGVADGTDAWIAPAVASLFSVNVVRLIEDLDAGRPIPKPERIVNIGSTPRVKLLEVPAKTARVKLIERTPEAVAAAIEAAAEQMRATPKITRRPLTA